MSHLPYHWKERFCQMLLIPLKPQTMRFLEAWQRSEGGSAENNPLNTQYAMPGSTDYNSVGVKNYKTPIEGICAQACTLARNPDYLDLWKSMQGGIFTAEDLVERNRFALSIWGTNPDVIARVLAEIP